MRFLPGVVSVLASLAVPGGAHAHAPLARDLALAPAGAGSAVRMPGFGWLVRTQAERSPDEPAAGFVYACDALLEVGALDEVPMAYRSDGTLLVGTADGIRGLCPDGCPAQLRALEGRAIAALAVDSAGQRAYAVTAPEGEAAVVWRSDDGGETWSAGATLAAHPVSALIVDPTDLERVYVSQEISNERSLLALSSDAGDSFETFAQGRAITLRAITVMDARSERVRLWATAKVPAEPVGVSVLRASGAEGPWTQTLAVNFFGGLATDPADADVIWVGDEARGVFRSGDGGDSFEEIQPDVAAACLAHRDGALWACAPGLPQDPALVRSPDGLAPFTPVFALAEVTRLADCAPELDVAHVCAAAWAEWQRDVVAASLVESAPEAAGAAMTPSPAADEASTPAQPEGMPSSAAGCRVGGANTPIVAASFGLLLLLLPLRQVARVRRRPQRRSHGLDAAIAVCDGVAGCSMATDVELMAHARDGDADAFAEIYDRHAPVMLALARRMLGRADEANDLLHDVFLEAWQRVREYDAGRASPRTWLIVRLRSRALDRRAREARVAGLSRALEELPALDGTTSAPPPNPAEQRHEVARALHELDGELRRVLELTYFDGLTALEISALDGTPVGTIRSRLARGISRLRRLLGIRDEGTGGNDG